MCGGTGGLLFGYDLAGAGGTFGMVGYQRTLGYVNAAGNRTASAAEVESTPATRQYTASALPTCPAHAVCGRVSVA